VQLINFLHSSPQFVIGIHQFICCFCLQILLAFVLLFRDNHLFAEFNYFLLQIVIFFRKLFYGHFLCSQTLSQSLNLLVLIRHLFVKELYSANIHFVGVFIFLHFTHQLMALSFQIFFEIRLVIEMVASKINIFACIMLLSQTLFDSSVVSIATFRELFRPIVHPTG
jgi:hypothetical protein